MFKAIVFAAFLALAIAAPEPKAKPGILAAAYASPLAYTAPVVSAYSAPVVSAYSAYSAPYVSTYGVAPAIGAYSPYTAPVVYA